MSSISSVAAGAGVSIITNSGGNSASGKPGQAVEPTGSASSSVPLLYYSSPRIFVDPQYGQVVYDYRDQTTGISTKQVPSRQALDAYRVTQTIQPSAATAGTTAVVASAASAPQGPSTPAPSVGAAAVSAAPSAPIATGSGASTIA